VKIKVDTVSSHLTHDRGFRKLPIMTIVQELQHCNAVVKHDAQGREYVQLHNWHVAIHPKKVINGVTHVDIVTAWDTAA
jgi:hypothetical protein